MNKFFEHKGSTLVEILLYFAIIGVFLFAAMTFAIQILVASSVSTNVSEVQSNWNLGSQKMISSIQLGRRVDLESSVFNEDNGVLALYVPVRYEDLPEYQELSAGWGQHLNGNGSTQWTITNPNPVPITSVPNVKVRYNWYAYSGPDLTGTVVSSVLGSDSPNPNPVNTAYAKSFLVEWYIEDYNEYTEVVGCTYVNSDGLQETSQCTTGDWLTQFYLEQGTLMMQVGSHAPVALSSSAVHYDILRFTRVVTNRAPDHILIDARLSPGLADLANLEREYDFHTAISLRPF